MHGSIAIWSSAVILATCLVSLLAFRNNQIERKLVFCPENILAGKQFYRLITSAFLHADGRHLLFNMISFYLFSENIEFIFGPVQMLVIYFGSIVGGSLLSLLIHRNHDYLALGASGGVCGLIFAHIFLFPGGSISFFFLPIGIPSWLYAIIFMAASFYGMQSRKDNIGHDAHLGGAVFGFAITFALHPDIVITIPKLFWAVCVISILILFYLILNPLWLPLSSFANAVGTKSFTWRPQGGKAKEFKVDLLLDKISQHGMDSLTNEERAFLDGVSGKYRRRAESKKPESELLF